MPRHLPAAATALATALLLGACSMGTSGSAADNDASVGVDADGAHVEAPGTSVDAGSDGGATVATDDDADPSGENAGSSSDRAEYARSVTRQLDCSGGSETVSATGQVVEVTADCASVTVSGNGCVVLAQGVDGLTVSGLSNVVVVASAGTVEISGDGNAITWESGGPDVEDTGFANVYRSAS